MNAKELTRLIDDYLDGQLTPAESEELSRVLTTEPGARRQFWEHAGVHGLMQEAARLEWLGATAPEVENKVVRLPWWRWAAPVAAAAALLVLAVAWWLRSPGERPASGVAVLSRAVGAQWADASASRPAGTVLKPGILQLKSGAALLEFYSGARVVLEGPAEFRLVSSAEGYLRSGKVSAHVPPQARGFKVGSPKLNVVDLGTEFGFEVTEHGATEVHVFAGKVNVSSPNTAARSLNGGEAVRLEAGTWQNLPATRAAFLSESELAQRDMGGVQQRYAAWRESSRALSAAPATVIHYTFEPQSSWERTLKNQASGAPPETDGSIVGCTWAEGRWPGKRALEFRGEGDRVRLTVAQPLSQFTFLAWVRAESLPRPMHSLLSAEAEQPGALRWELTGNGRLRLGIARDLGHSKPDWEAVISDPVVTPDRFGQWLLLATTFDGSTIRHYCNGQLVGSGASFRPAALLIGAADIGNWHGQNPRNLAASMDEFTILARALTAEEVLTFYQRGQP